ncbi:MAG: ribonucleotide-diphosphate reductase subunit beta [Candidatus Lightella neohaematopini]|nr:ribonucleotide-diphosphate reductase subunit beta [Candidatus Lightella neohaematopini]MCV2531222.1 ribonucleotide-diphosphate reductase subunit beta [Candidatus Lightella neohaematopini]
MLYTTFSQIKNNQLLEPMFFGQPVNISRFDQQKYIFFEKLIEKQLSFFWRPEEIDISRDRIDYLTLSEKEKHIFLSNLKYQTLLDSIQSRSPTISLLPIISIPELETWIETWSFYETIHSRSYTHIIRNVINDPSLVFDNIISNKEILKRSKNIVFYYDELINFINYYNLLGVGTHYINGNKIIINLKILKEKLYLCLISICALESIRFYVSFACAFAFAERKLMEGNAKIIRLIARDEALHVTGTQYIINLIHSGKDDKEMSSIAYDCRQNSNNLFLLVAQQEKDWVDYLFCKGNIIGLNKEILYRYIEYITNIRMRAIGFNPIFNINYNPIPWINNWLTSDNVQMAPQEVEVSSYLVGQIDSEINYKELSNFKL